MEPLQRCQSLEISNLDIFFGPASPTKFAKAIPPGTFFFIWTPYSPHRAISREKRGYIYQRLQLVEYSSNQTLAYIGVTKKKLSLLFVCNEQRATREKMKPETVIQASEAG